MIAQGLAPRVSPRFMMLGHAMKDILRYGLLRAMGAAALRALFYTAADRMTSALPTGPFKPLEVLPR